MVASAAAQPISLHPKNPKCFLFEGKPTVLITSGEHYGAVLNQEFNYVKYLDTLRADRLNLTRTFTGNYIEVPGNFNITSNMLAPRPGKFIAPWPQRDGKFDLTRWDDAYFVRLKDFLTQAAKRGIVVELVLFCPFYEDSMWSVSPMNAKNNVNGIGAVDRKDVLALKDARLTEMQDAMVRKIVSELRDFDNLYYEICNEPYFAGVTLEWQEHISKVITETEASFKKKHLIAQNWANGSKIIDRPNPLVDLFNFHYSRPPLSVAMNAHYKFAIGNNETGFDGNADSTYRIQGWDFMIAGGALYNNLDYSFIVGREDGTFELPAATPGGGSVTLRKQLGHLRKFFDEIPFVQMQPDTEVLVREPNGPSVRALSEPGKLYAIYMHHGRLVKDGKPKYQTDAARESRTIGLQLPAGSYTAIWRDTKTGIDSKPEAFVVKGAGTKTTLNSPAYSEDIALLIRAKR